MTVEFPTCKLCGWTASSNDPKVSTPEVFEHWRIEHPEVWEEFQPLLDQWNQHKRQNPDWSDQVLDWYSDKTIPPGAGRTRAHRRKGRK